MAKIVMGFGRYCWVKFPDGTKAYRAYLFDPRKHGIEKLSRRWFKRASEAAAYSLVASARYERLLTAAGLHGRLEP